MHDLPSHNTFTSLALIFLDMANRSFKQFVEQELGVVPKFFIFAILEWMMILLLLVDGFVAFLANEFANFFELPAPCLLCTRIDHVLLCRNSDSICEHHKKKFSYLGFCHVHHKFSDMRNMCERCLLSFATEKGGDLFVDEDHELHLSFPGKKENDQHCCSCCGETLKLKSSVSPVSDMKSKNNSSVSALPSVPSPSPSPNSGQSLIDADDEEWKNPHFIKGKFFGIPLSDSVNDSPMWTRSSRKPLFLDRTESAFECRELQMANDSAEGDILVNLKRQLRLDRKSLMALYVELDEERSASAIAANNAMAMITRLQTEKASNQMEALQYQRMMEEQAQYDQEALEAMCDLVVKREEEIKDLMEELEECKRYYFEYSKEDYDQSLQEADVEEIADDLCLNQACVEPKQDDQSELIEENDHFLKEVNVERDGDENVEKKNHVLLPTSESNREEAQSFSGFDEEPEASENADNHHHPSDSMQDKVRDEESIDKLNKSSHDHPDNKDSHDQSDSMEDKVQDEVITEKPRKPPHHPSDSFPDKVQVEAIDKPKKPSHHPSNSVPDKFHTEKLMKRTSQHLSGSIPDKVQGEAIDKLIKTKVQGGAIDKLIRRTSQHLSGSVPDKVQEEAIDKLKRTSHNYSDSTPDYKAHGENNYKLMHLSDSGPDKSQGEAIDKQRRTSHHRVGSVPDKGEGETMEKLKKPSHSRAGSVPDKKALVARQLGRLKNLR